MTGPFDKPVSSRLSENGKEPSRDDVPAHDRFLEETRRINEGAASRPGRDLLYWSMAVVSALCLPAFAIGVVVCFLHPRDQDLASWLLVALFAAFPIAFSILYQGKGWQTNLVTDGQRSPMSGADGIWTVWGVITTIMLIVGVAKWVGKAWFFQ